MTEQCGAWQIGNDPLQGAIQFRLFLPVGADPHISSIRVAGTFQNLLGTADWDFAGGLPMDRGTSDPRGDFWTVRTGQMLPAGFYEYKYLVTFDNGDSRIVTDPCARYSGFSNQNSAVVVGGSQPADNTIRPLPGGRKPLADLNLYELMIDDFTAEYRGDRAPLDAITDRLDSLQALGITAVLFMPWTAWQNDSFDWGYAPLQYFAVEARYAHDPSRPAEKLSWLKQLISACHDRGIHVIMDGVFNHTSLDFPYKQLYRDQDVCPFTAGPFGGTFPGLQDLDFNNACTGEFIRDVCVYWMETFGIDGIRFDNTVNYYVAGNLNGLPELLADLSSWLDQKAEANFTFTLEHIDVSAATVTNTTPATSFWDNSLFSLCFQYLWDGQIDSRLLNALNNRRFLTAGKVPTLYLSNHDHSHAAWQAGARDNVGSTGAWWKLQPYLIALYTSTAVPLLPNGQEFGEDHFLPEDDHGTGRRVTGRPLQWKLRDDQIGQALVALHGTLVRMRRDHPGLRSGLMYPDVWEEWQTQPNPVGVGVDVASQIVIYHRWAVLENGSVENFVVVINFSGTDTVPSVPFPADGEWVDLLAGFDGSGRSWSATVLGLRASIPVGSHWGRILWRVNPPH
jgi:pullulanase/glycogen debranching enzyme